jgi:hypothetical protein
MLKLIATLGMLTLATCSGGTPAYAIFNCWTPERSMELAKEKGYLLLGVAQYEHFLVEEWLVDGKVIEVFYQHPMTGNQELWCYRNEIVQEGK